MRIWSLLLTVVCAASVAAGYRAVQPSQESGIKFKATPERLARGRYLVEGPMHCFACHSEASWEKDGLPKPGKKGAGQAAFPDAEIPFPLVVPNITPDPETGAGKWTDEQFERALRQGIGHDGRTLFPVMPYPLFRRLSDEDLASVVVYIRSVKPVRNPLPKRQLPPELEKTLRPLEPVKGPMPGPDPKDQAARGEYLATLGNCIACHTPFDMQTFQPLPGMDFAGGAPLHGPWGRVASMNLTPDASGISYYDLKLFLQVMRTGHVGARKLNQIMLWRYFRNMTDDDLQAIFAYLRSLKPVPHRVDNTEPPTACKLCRGVHGGGEWNDSLAAGSK